MSAEENKAIIRRYLEEAWEKGDWKVAEEIVAEDVVFHDQVREGELPPGREGLREAMRRFRVGVPDMKMNVEEIIAEGDFVVIRWHSPGTNTGELNGIPPTMRAGTLYAISMVRMKDGRIVEGWQESDRMGLAQQLGLFPKGKMPKPMASALAATIRFKDRLSRRPR